MSGFENYRREALEIEQEIERKGIALGVDWSDQVQVRALAREALDHGASETHAAAIDNHDRHALTKAELFGLAALMLKTMEQSAQDGMLTHGGPTWKAFGKALWQEQELRKASQS